MKQSPPKNREQKAAAADDQSSAERVQQVVEKVESMSVQERFDSLVRCGILTQAGKLAPEYGG